MSFAYNNPYAPQQPNRSTFAAGFGGQRFKVLFSGLPPDVSEKDLRDILLQPPLSLPATNTVAQCIYDQSAQFTGSALVEVGNEIDAERIRREFSGQVIDGTFQLLVQHVLAPSQSLPSSAHIPAQAPQPAPTPRQTPTAPKAASKPNANAPKAQNKPAGKDKAPGLQLLARMKKPGAAAKPPTKEQAALLARQKANLKSKSGSNNLLARLATTPKSGAAGKKGKTAAKPAAGGASKVGRAKQNAAKDKMDVDAEPSKKQQPKAQKAKPKTQAELDAEMALWERQRRFAT